MAECTIYDKLRYIAETKDLIKAAIEAQDVKVLESATFRQYAEYITQIRKVSSVNGMQGDVTITAADLGALTEIPSEYITETELNEKGYLTAVPDVYITEDELSSQLADKVSQNGLNEAIEGVRNDIPTNVSQLTNDSGYITLNEVPKVDLSGYALKSEIPDISVKQDKLTAGNGISITDNVISLDYEYDLFEVVQSLPTENISDNKVYLLLDSNGSEGNTYVEYLYVNGQWEELGKFKVNVDLSGYATEDWVNSQGFLKEHQDISNLATKEELNAKQDTISDLETIRSGAAKGATALQSVPSTYATEQWVNEQGFLKEHQDISNLATKQELATKQDVITDLDTIRSGASKGATALQSVPDTYALKSDILSAKTDERYTDYDVQNPVLSGNTIVLQNEVTDSRKYHTLGYEKTITTSVPVQKYINITRNYNGVPSMDTNVESGIGFDGANINGEIPFTLDKINAVTNLMHYEVSYVERDSEGNVTGGGETDIADIIYDPNTKLLSVPGAEFTFAQIRRSDKNTYLFGGGTDGTEYFENGRTYYNFEQNPLQEGATLIWMPYYSSGLYWDYSVTINGIFYQEGSVTTDDKPERLNDYIRYSNNVKAYILTDKNTTFKTINGEQITGNGDITIDTNVDLSNYATKSELATKQDVITDLETIRSGAALGATALQTVPSGYATEQWVNEQGFLKEHQDISNLATKDELNAKQDTINDLDTIRSGAAKGATALQSVPSGYATEQWVSQQGFLKEHQDISNLATKEELATKQDVITDLDTIRSGASKGATALQSVPSEYAKKTDIPDISTKQDVIPDLEAIRSGAAKGETALQSVPNTYALKSEIPDISVKQDKLTAGNGISITDNVISLDYEYDLFEVVPSLPTENISDNKIYLVYQSDGDGNNLYIEYIYVSGHWEELGKFKANVDLSGYATEEWVNSQGFLKEHQDISNLATKDELSTKQDTINDLDSIRSGAALGATALQSVPEEYAKKTDIPDISTKQDVITDLDTIRSGASKGATALQTVPSGYATEEWVNGQGFLKEHQDISNLATKAELATKQDVISDLDTIRSGAEKGATALQSVPDTYALKTDIPDISTKQDKLVSGTNIKTVNGTSLLGSGNIVIEASADNVPTVQTTPNGTTSNYIYSTISHTNPQYSVISDISNFITYSTDKASIATYKRYWGQESSNSYQNWSINAATNSKAGLMTASDKSKLDGIDLSTKQDKLVSGTNIKTVNGTSLLGSGDITIEGGSGNVDLTDYYTKTETNALVNPKLQQVTLTQAEYDALATKEDNVLYIISDAEDLKFKTINGQQITGEGNIEIKASADNVPTLQTTVEGTTNNYIYSSGRNDKYGVISDIKNLVSYEEDKASINTGWVYWGTSSVIDAAYGWSINAATTSQAGLMSSSDKTKLDGIDITLYATKTELNAKQDTLVSGTNIKTVNGISLLGEGNITISGEGGADLSGYYTKAEIDAMIGGASTTITQINNLVV